MATDTLYFLDGSKKMAVNLLQGTANEVDFRFVSPGSNVGTPEPGLVAKSEVYYHYSNGEYHLINERTLQTEQDRLRKNLLRYNKQRNAGVGFVMLGVGMLTGSMLAAEVQVSKMKKGEVIESENLPKIMQLGIVLQCFSPPSPEGGYETKWFLQLEKLSTFFKTRHLFYSALAPQIRQLAEGYEMK